MHILHLNTPAFVKPSNKSNEDDYAGEIFSIKVSTHSDHANLLYKELSDAFKLKFADVKKAGSLANEFNQEELVREIR